MPRTKEQYEALREASRQKIHTAAVKLFSQKGLAATSVQEIADSAQISTGLMYRHYKSKEELFGAMVKEALTGFEYLGKLFESDMPPMDVLNMIVEEFLNDVSHNEEFIQYMTMFSQPFIMNHRYSWMEDILEQDKRLFAQMGNLIKRGQDSGHFKSGDPAQMAQHYFSMIQGIFIMKHILKEEFIPPTRDMMTSFLLKEGVSYEAK